MDKTYALLQEIKKRPEIYLGQRSLPLLRAFISGYKEHETEVLGEYQPDCLDGFNEFMQERHRLCTDHDWSSVIRFFSTSDAEALDTFYEELETFLAAKASGTFVAVKPWEKFTKPKA